MRPAFSVLFLTTLIGAGQGLFIALFFCELLAHTLATPNFLIGGAAIVEVLRAWAHPLTLVNFTVLGTASGMILAAAYAGFAAPELAAALAQAAFALTLFGLFTRSVALLHNARLSPASTMQSALGIRYPKIVQKSQGAMVGTYNTHEYFHGKSIGFVHAIMPTFLISTYFLPLALVYILPLLAFIVQYVGLLTERWFFFAEARHPQNLYYQGKSGCCVTALAA